mmetsp:Transcript_35864/g.83616  ORF Transcript_35864/g.83616 Transcript_35864/m.83616 type:complete len:205 (+) Transcript_35864:1474-2088(+)
MVGGFGGDTRPAKLSALGGVLSSSVVSFAAILFVAILFVSILFAAMVWDSVVRDRISDLFFSSSIMTSNRWKVSRKAIPKTLFGPATTLSSPPSPRSSPSSTPPSVRAVVSSKISRKTSTQCRPTNAAASRPPCPSNTPNVATRSVPTPSPPRPRSYVVQMWASSIVFRHPCMSTTDHEMSISASSSRREEPVAEFWARTGRAR